MEWIIVAILSIVTQLITGIFIVVRKIIKNSNHAKNRNINIFSKQTIQKDDENEDKKETQSDIMQVNITLIKMKEKIFQIGDQVKKIDLDNKLSNKKMKGKIFQIWDQVKAIEHDNKQTNKILTFYFNDTSNKIETKKIIGELLNEKINTMA